ncbi:MAG: hypothetical protein DHS20C05_03780 [Hyphococcus sp.]|nr:MAG: hypothetical protein DHS20C05_03780 [Marinicaulis sp.]
MADDGSVRVVPTGAATRNDNRQKFDDPDVTATGAVRAHVDFDGLKTLWVNTGTLCNVECSHCYIESSPKNDRLVYLSSEDLSPFLKEAAGMGAREIGFTGGEPFMNPDMLMMARASLEAGFEVLILTNAMRPMLREQIKKSLMGLREQYGARLKLRISLDHYTKSRHDEERGAGSFDAGLAGLGWLSECGFSISVAGRTLWGETETVLRKGFANLFTEYNFTLDANDPQALILFPEMDEAAPVPEITTDCWETLGKSPHDIMCASSRMLVKRKGEKTPVVLSCTLLAYDRAFEMGPTLEAAARPVKLNHPHCAKFCILGGASCSG